LIVKAGWL